MKNKKKKNKKWMRFRHKVVRNVAFAVIGLYTKLKTGVKVEQFKEQGKRPYLIIMNHQTAFDQFFVGMAFRGPVYYIASEDLFSNGFISKLLSWAVAPIPIKKQTTDVHAVMNCIRVAREGGTIALAPEGNRTYSGRMCYFKPSILALVKKLKLPLAIFRIEGGYGVQPRWSDVTRKGRMRAYVSEVIEPEEYEKLSNDALLKRITDGMSVDETKIMEEYFHKKNAEYMERAMYVCPFCGLSTFESHNDTVTCKTCGRTIRYLPNKTLVGEGFDFPYANIADWYEYQSRFVNGLDLLTMDRTKPVYTDTVDLSEVILYKNKQPVAENAQMSLYPDRITLTKDGNAVLDMPFGETAVVTVLGRNKLNVYFGDKVWQMKGDKRFNALKYVHFYHRYKNLAEGDNENEFLGL
ncbi:MAG: 1-acyl-sn-glycerol-3-phosphate acyltransferase [Clostridia bacterium]|nr:1-acyl-sn-glycerol-3-phosphate acyltransferase [Clostridia bacterium]